VLIDATQRLVYYAGGGRESILKASSAIAIAGVCPETDAFAYVTAKGDLMMFDLERKQLKYQLLAAHAAGSAIADTDPP
jgi:hypothetical protein